MKPYYQDKWVTIYHGDCREILPQLDVKVDLVLTDPPYNINKAIWDNLQPKEYMNLLPKVMKDGAALYCFYSCLRIPEIQSVIETYFVLKNVCVWWSPNFPGFLKAKDRYCFTWQPCFYATNGQKALFNVYDFSHYGADNSNDVWRYPCPQTNFNNDKKEHITQKPRDLFSRIIAASSDIGCLILDPFLGSGTTCFCAKKLNRYSIGIEIEEKYCEIAARRCSQEVMELK
jgi:DNA modification methylase